MRGELGLPGAEEAPVASQALFLSRRVETLTARVAELETYIATLNGDTSTTLPSPTAAPARVIGVGKASTAFDDDSVRTAVTTYTTRRTILEQLGVTYSSKNYGRLEARARTRHHPPGQAFDRAATAPHGLT